MTWKKPQCNDLFSDFLRKHNFRMKGIILKVQKAIEFGVCGIVRDFLQSWRGHFKKAPSSCGGTPQHLGQSHSFQEYM
jgi:hypothetical protein